MAGVLFYDPSPKYIASAWSDNFEKVNGGKKHPRSQLSDCLTKRGSDPRMLVERITGKDVYW